MRGTPIEAMARFRSGTTGFLKSGWAAKDLFAWNARQTSIALGQFMTSAATMGIDTSPMEGLDTEAYDELLGLTETRYATLCAYAAGYRAEDDRHAGAPKVRYPHDEVIERR